MANLRVKPERVNQASQSPAVRIAYQDPPTDRPPAARRYELSAAPFAGPQGRVHHSPESVALGFQEVGQYLLDSLNFLEEVCAFLEWHGCAPARMAAVI